MLDKHISKEVLIKKIGFKECYIIVHNNMDFGILRYNLFWDNTPFMNMIYISEGYRKKGIGKMAVSFWEDEMRLSGYKTVMTSTQADESAQYFYRAIGYKDSGCLIFDTQPLEIILTKNITTC